MTHQSELPNIPSAQADHGDYNTETCAWDGGDCCASTCNNTEVSPCGANGYDCKDPSSPDYGEGRGNTVESNRRETLNHSQETGGCVFPSVWRYYVPSWA